MADSCLVYVGTYTDPIAHVPESTGKGVMLYTLDLADGSLSQCAVAEGVVNPSYLAFSPDKRFLYAVSEINERGGHVAAFARDEESGSLTLLNQQPAHGQAACYLLVDHTGRYLLTANYMDGSACVYPIEEDGSLGELSDWVQHEGTGPNPRQDRAHIHCVQFDRNQRYLFLSDLGTDRIVGYTLEREEGRFVPHNEVHVQPGGGPRHFLFSEGGRFGYSLQELDSTLVVFSYEEEKGELTKIQTIATLPDDFAGENITSTLRIHPSGRFLYVANRGHNSIAIYEIDQQEGTLTLVGRQLSGGVWPRDFNIEPSGQYLLVGHQDSDTIVTFRIDQETGALQPLRETAVPTPVCIQFLEIAGSDEH